jgi:cellulose synthase/poly-beta-1,6-N-acetylglucosamine synthase-like glycosyltransferase
MKLGQILLNAGVITPEQLADALEQQGKYGGRLGEILQGITHVRALDFYKGLAEHFSLPFVNLLEQVPEKSLLNAEERAIYVEQLFLPVAKEGDVWTIATANPCQTTFDFLKKRYGDATKMVVTSKFDIIWTLQKYFDDRIIQEVVNDLFEKTPHMSAATVLSNGQKVFFLIILFTAIVTGLISGHLLLMIFNGVITVAICGTLVYKLFLTVLGLTARGYKQEKLLKINDKDLPVYSVLVPLYQENELILAHLIKHLELLDYPRHLLDIKLLIEKDDLTTIGFLKKMNLPTNYEFIYVPFGGPRTKPKACSYGLKFARGEFMTIYDAEDAPDPDQLRKVVATFREGDERLGCVQCHLSYYNSKENWLTKMFTLEYSYWFDLMLPALSMMRWPIPLGGTSNHMRTAFLNKISAWDPFNVTEDAELGIRLARLGLITQVINSTTQEEAPSHMRNWFYQRTRWLKGYMQTYLTHMRRPFKLLRILGPFGFLSFQLFIGGTILSNFCNIIVWIIFAVTLTLGPAATNFMFPSPIIEMAWFNFIVGSLIVIILNILGILRRKMYSLLLFSLTSPIYWLLMSLANYRAIWHLIVKPSHWEKTTHGTSGYIMATEEKKQ